MRSIAAGVAGLCAAAGVISWRITGSSDLLTAGASFAGMIAITIVARMWRARPTGRRRKCPGR